MSNGNPLEFSGKIKKKIILSRNAVIWILISMLLKVGSCPNDDNFVQNCFCPFLCSI